MCITTSMLMTDITGMGWKLNFTHGTITKTIGITATPVRQHLVVKVVVVVAVAEVVVVRLRLTLM